MYTSRRHRRPVATDAHTGSRQEFLHRLEAEAKLAAHGPGPTRDTFLAAVWERITDTRTLMLAAQYLVKHGGPAAGVDGISPADLDTVDVVALARNLREELRSGRYRPAPDRNVEIPKGPGRGTRTLSLSVVADRVVQRAILMIIQPYIDPQFVPTSFGGRPGLSTADALIAAEKVVLGTGHRVVAGADIRKAFDCVPHDNLVACFRRWFGTSPLCDLLATIVTTGRTVGIRQGGALSMMLLNLFLDEHLDVPFARLHSTCTLIRWVDDLIVIAPDREEVDHALGTVNRILSEVGREFGLKDGIEIGDLSTGGKAEWLGLVVGIENDTHMVGVSAKRWGALDQSIRDAHGEDCPTRHARDSVRGWVYTIGPVTPGPEIVDRMRDTLSRWELEGAATRDEMMEWWLGAHAKYLGKRKKELNENNTARHDAGMGGEPTAPPLGTLSATHVPNSATDVDQSCIHDRIDHLVLDDGDHPSEHTAPTGTTGRAVRVAVRNSSLGFAEGPHRTGKRTRSRPQTASTSGHGRAGTRSQPPRGSRGPPARPPP